MYWTTKLKKKKIKFKEDKKIKRVFNKKERYIALRNNRRKKALMNYMTSQLCKYAKSKGYDQIVIEDLQFVLSKCYITNKEFEVNYNDLFSILHLRELKHVIPRIANRHNVVVQSLISCNAARIHMVRVYNPNIL